MEVSWDKLVNDLQHFPGDQLALVGHSGPKLEECLAHNSAINPSVTIDVLPGEVLEHPKVRLRLEIAPSGVDVRVSEDDPMDEGIAAALVDASRVGLGQSTAAAVRSVLLRLCSDLHVEFGSAEAQALLKLGRVQAAPPASGKPELNREVSHATSAPTSEFSFESMTYEQNVDEDMEAGCDEKAFPGANSCTYQGYAASLRARREQVGPSVDDVLVWNAIIDSLKRFNGSSLKLSSATSWDGIEGQVQLVCQAPPECTEWQMLALVIFVRVEGATVELRRAQVVPPVVDGTINELNRAIGPMSGGPSALRDVILSLCEALQLNLSEPQQSYMESLGDRGVTQALQMLGHESTFVVSAELKREMQAIEAMQMQLEVIAAHASYIQSSIDVGCAHADELKRELRGLQRTEAVVLAERDAAKKSVEAVLLSFTDTKNQNKKGVDPPAIEIEDLPSQSLRGHGMRGAAEQVGRALATVGAWGHYAAYQYSLMLKREQELHSDFICVYHSYSFASILYEVHSLVAQHIFGLPADFAPLPRLLLQGVCGEACMSLKSLQTKGGQDHDPRFRALGLSVSCSLFASGSEAPPLTCFQGGYSCNDLSFRGLLVTFLTTCLGKDASSNKTLNVEKLADEVVEVGGNHRLPVSCFRRNNNGAQGMDLAGYMLQIFIHRSIATSYAYPSQPYGVPIKGEGDIVEYLMKRGTAADGQARVLFHPPTFVNPSTARLFHYCARPLQSCMSPEVPESRGSLLRELKRVLKPVLEVSPDDLAARLGLS